MANKKFKVWITIQRDYVRIVNAKTEASAIAKVKSKLTKKHNLSRKNFAEYPEALLMF
jgi:hypothetical protein